MARESHVIGGLEVNDGTSYAVVEHTFRPAQETPDMIGSADSEGSLLFEQPNPEPLVHEMVIRVVQQATANLAAAKVGALLHRFAECAKQPDGLADVWTPQDMTTSYTIYVLHAQVIEAPRSPQDALMRSPLVRVLLTCKPYLYGPEVVGSPVTSTLPAFTVTVADVPGHAPAEGRLIITDNATQARRHVEWGLESRYLNAALPKILDSDSLVTSGFSGGGGSKPGDYDPGASGSSSVVVSFLTPRATSLCGTGSQSHVGTFKVKARIYAEAFDHHLRLMWRAGDNAFGPTAKGYVTPPAINEHAEVDLGEITIPPAILGTQSWEGRIDVYSDTIDPTSDFWLDYLLLIPVAEGYGKARGNYTYNAGVRTAHHEFTGLASGLALASAVPPQGGVWTTSGAATDWAAADLPVGEETMARSATSGTRYGVLSLSTATNVEVGVRVQNVAGTVSTMGALARWVDSSNHLAAVLDNTGLSAYVNIGGTPITVLSIPYTPALATWYGIRVVAFTSGKVVLTLLDASGATVDVAEGWNLDLATGGTLASGLCGMIDSAAGGAGARYYDDFYAATPPAESIAINSGQSLEVRHDGCIRENAAGTIWGKPWYRGSRLLIPQAGYQDRDSQILVKARRNDIDVASDPNIADSTTAQINYTPRYRMPAP